MFIAYAINIQNAFGTAVQINNVQMQLCCKLICCYSGLEGGDRWLPDKPINKVKLLSKC